MGERTAFAEEKEPKTIELPVLAKKLDEKEVKKRLERAYTLAFNATVTELKKQKIDIDISNLKEGKQQFVEKVFLLISSGLKQGEILNGGFDVRNANVAKIFASELQKQIGIEKPAEYNEKNKISFEDARIVSGKLPVYITQSQTEPTKIEISWPPWITPSTIEMEQDEDIVSKGFGKIKKVANK